MLIVDITRSGDKRLLKNLIRPHQPKSIHVLATGLTVELLNVLAVVLIRS